jgi:branched-subunit amino acid aminotransferase/4-amino-4-deoxychorismate lyase
MGGVMPVTKIDGRPTGEGQVGPLTREASALYLASVGAD